MKKIIFQILTVFSVFLVACEDEEVKWEVEPVNQMLVVEGSFTDQLKKHQVILTLSENYFANHKTTRVTDANVSITDGTNTFSYIQTSIPGVYETADSVAGVPGTNYTLSIDLKSPVNGTNHYYCSSVMGPSIKIDSMAVLLFKNPYYKKDLDIDSMLVTLTVFGQEPPAKGNCYSSEFYVNNINLNDTIDQKIFFDDEMINGNYVNEFYKFSNKIKPGDTVKFQLFSVKRDYQDFATGVVQIAEYNDPLGFSGPPANAIGNIKGAKALGYFLISSVGESSCIVESGIEK